VIAAVPKTWAQIVESGSTADRRPRAPVKALTQCEVIEVLADVGAEDEIAVGGEAWYLLGTTARLPDRSFHEEDFVFRGLLL
jgi:hypothetical protein